MTERKPAKKVAKKSAKSIQGFTDEERAAMRDRAYNSKVLSPVRA